LIYNNEGTQRVFRPKNKSINMALIKIKQIEGLRVINDGLAASVNSLETITSDNATNIGTNAGDIDSLEASVTSLEAIVSNKLDGADLANLEASVNSLETITSDNATDIGTNAGDIDSLEASVNSLETVTSDNATDIGTNAGDIDSLEASVTSLEAIVSNKLEASDLSDLEASVNSLETVTGTNATNIGTNAGDIDSLEASVTSLETITSDNASNIADNASDIAGIVSREIYGAEDVDGYSQSAGALLTVGFTPSKFAAHPYDYEVYVNGVKTLQAWVANEFDGTNVGLILPYDVEETDVFTIKGIDLIP
jgi:exonuclease VII small subunit